MQKNQVVVCGHTDLEIYEAGKICNVINWRHPERTMDANVFLVVLEGVLRVNEDGIDYELKKDEAFFLKSGLHQKAVKPTDDGTSWCYVHFYDNICKGCDGRSCMLHSNRRLAAADSWHLVLPKRILLPNFEAEKFKLAMQDMAINYSSNLHLTRMRLSLELKELFIDLMELEHSENDSTSGIVTRIINVLRSNALTNISSKEISEQLGLNYQYLSRTFSKATGMTIVEYKNYLKVQKAINSFKTEHMNIYEVATGMGFENQFYFSTVFKRITGMSPQEYIKSIYTRNPDNIIAKK